MFYVFDNYASYIMYGLHKQQIYRLQKNLPAPKLSSTNLSLMTLLGSVDKILDF